MLRAKYIRNATDGNGTLFRGDMYQVPMTGKLGGTTGQRIWETNVVAQYTLGTRLVLGDGRVFRYAKAGGTLVTSYGCEQARQSAVIRTALTAAAAVGDTSVTFDVAATDGTCVQSGVGDGSITKNDLAGGYIVMERVIGNIDNCQTRMITANTATEVNGGTMTVTFDDPLVVALESSSDYVACIFSPYKDVRSTTHGSSQTIGVPCMIAAEGSYLWIQTWGPCWVTTQPRVNLQIYDGQVVFRHDGSVDNQVWDDATVRWAQHAGFVLANAGGTGGHTQGGAFIMLQISP